MARLVRPRWAVSNVGSVVKYVTDYFKSRHKLETIPAIVNGRV